ncbi:MAG: Uma2 family endonuclease [Solirubrobacteraceae bacterium]
MPTLIPDPLPVEVEALLERRREWGADRHDEVWEGVLHMSPPPSSRHELLVVQLTAALLPLAKAQGLAVLGAAGIGVKDNHRVPDLTLLRSPIEPQWQPTAALAVEVLSWREPAAKKLDFYATHHVDELLIVNPNKRQIEWLVLREGAYQPVERSDMIDLGPVKLAGQIDWDPFPVTEPDGSN